jgi:hypothetical protein
MAKLRVLDLFSGIGGFSLGLERSGLAETIAFCEFDREAQNTLRARYRVFPFMTMFAHLPETDSETTAFSRLQSLEDFPAKMLVLQAVEQVLQAHAAGCGPSSPDWLANFDQISSEWKTSQLSLDGELEPFSETWPRSGMMLNGTAYRLPTLVPDNFGTECGLWPTPNATAFKGGRQSPRRGVKNPERNNWQDWCSLVLGQRYPVPETAEQVMGFPVGYTAISNSETP